MNEPLRIALDFGLRGVAVLIVAALMPGFRVRGFWDAVLFAVVVAFLNTLAWQACAALSITATVVTLGIAGFVINGLILLLAQKIARGVEISGCVVASLSWFAISFVNSLIQQFVKDL